VSHASEDQKLVDAFVDLLESGAGVSAESVFCSSRKGQSIKPGSDFTEVIRKRLESATCVIAIVSEAFYSSAYCLCELGAAWVQDKFLPVLVPTFNSTALKAVLAGRQACRIDQSHDLDELRDEIGKALELRPTKTPRWNTRRDAFLEQLPALLKLVTYKGPVPRDAHEKVLKELAEYKQQCSTHEQAIATQKELIRELKSTKSRKSVAKIEKKYSTEQEQFDALVAKIQVALARLPRHAKEALYYEQRGDTYTPRDPDDWASVERDAENGFVYADRDDGTVTSRDDNTDVWAAAQAVKALRRWLDTASDEFAELYATDTKGAQLDMSVRKFWIRHLL
jgi:hypothetical protein